MDIHPLTNHDIATARVAEVVRHAREAQRRVVKDERPSAEPGWRFVGRLRRRRAAAAAQPTAI